MKIHIPASISTEISPSLQHHLDNDISIAENLFRYRSDAWCDLVVEARKLWFEFGIEADEDEIDLFNSSAGKKELYEGQEVIIDCPDWLHKDGELVKNSYVVHTYGKTGEVQRIEFISENFLSD